MVQNSEFFAWNLMREIQVSINEHSKIVVTNVFDVNMFLPLHVVANVKF